MRKILVVEDGRAVQRAMKRLLEPEGFQVQFASDGGAALEYIQKAKPDLVLLDLGLPKLSGRDVCERLKKDLPDVPIIVVSAKSDVWDKVLLLELGATDYVTKPFSPRELLARIRAALRRGQSAENPESTDFGDVAVNLARMEVRRGNETVSMTPQEFKVLKYFLQNPERVISREELLNEVWGYANYPSTRTVDNHVLKLRQKLEKDPESPQHFRTVHAVGYKFVP
jgi:DNA-binding response OmpR family regulator